jgi:hypothetical protein
MLGALGGGMEGVNRPVREAAYASDHEPLLVTLFEATCCTGILFGGTA